MAAKKCLKCGKTNPHFFTHCVACGAKLDTDAKKGERTSAGLKAGLAICVSLILVIFVIFPVTQYFMTFGQDFSEKVSANPAKESQIITEYPLNRPVGNNDFQITIISARDGQNTYNSNKFFIVSVYMKNNGTAGNVRISNSDFELIDSEGTKYYPYGIGSMVMYDLSQSQSGSGELTFVIPQTVAAKKVRFTFPGSSTLASSRHVVVFVI
jgi:hypothetical protein